MSLHLNHLIKRKCQASQDYIKNVLLSLPFFLISFVLKICFKFFHFLCGFLA